MSMFSDIIAGVGTTLAASIPSLHVYNHPPDSVNEFPAAIIQIDPIDPEIAFGGNSIEGDIRVTLFFGSRNFEEAFANMYDAMDPTNSNTSVIAAIRADQTLNGSVDDSNVTLLENIGRREANDQPFAGFDAIIHFIKTVA